jgi:hypothetical protein
MAVNQARSMNAEFAQGSVDCTYIQLAPNRSAVENPPVDRAEWPTYRNVGQWPSNPFVEAHMWRFGLPREIMNSGDGDSRF